MPWYAHQAAVEGLLWEQPWVKSVLTLDPEKMSRTPFDENDESTPTTDSDVNGSEGVFVGVRPDEVMR
jgi:hypothetical protein